MKTRAHEQPKASSPARPRRAALSPAHPCPPQSIIEKLAAEQGVKQRKWDEIVGMGANLWASDAEFEEFVKGIRDRRQQDLQQCR
jgi:hypothetical protein